jgi:hypothetical protein
VQVLGRFTYLFSYDDVVLMGCDAVWTRKAEDGDSMFILPRAGIEITTPMCISDLTSCSYQSYADLYNYSK